MSKRVGLFSGWLAATLALGFVGYAAVALVGDQVTDQPTGRVVNLSAATTLDDRLIEADGISDGTIGVSSQSEVLVPDTSFDDFGPDLTDPITAPETTVTTTTVPDTEPAPPATTPPPPATAPPTTAPAPTSPPTTAVPPTTTIPDDDDSDDQEVTGPFSFMSEGGTVTVTCIEDRVRFGGASPSGSASINVLERGPQEVVVRFSSGNSVWTTIVTCEEGVASAEFS